MLFSTQLMLLLGFPDSLQNDVGFVILEEDLAS